MLGEMIAEVLAWVGLETLASRFLPGRQTGVVGLPPGTCSSCAASSAEATTKRHWTFYRCPCGKEWKIFKANPSVRREVS
jgi:hypothetical protein